MRFLIPSLIWGVMPGTSCVVRRSSGGIEAADEGDGSPAQIDDPVDGGPVFGLQGFHRQQLRLGHESGERIVDGVTEIERHLASGGELPFGVP